MKGSKQIHIGTSGWNYRHWRGPFYPEEVAQKKWLSYYSERLKTVEINNSFYRLPKETTFENWRNTVPPDFIFSVKASRYITHVKKLKEPEDSIKLFLGRAEKLQEKLGPILFQLPPGWNYNEERLQAFLGVLPKEFRYAIEFRNQSWLRPETYRALAQHNVAFCIYQFRGELSPKEVTADFVYIRLHGPNRQEYTGQYDSVTLTGWAGAFSTWRNQEKAVYCYFDNDENGYAVQDALRLQSMIYD